MPKTDNELVVTAARVLESLHDPTCMVGSINADLTVETATLPGPGQTVTGGPLQVLPGGKSANQAATAGRLGAPATFIGAVGTDTYGPLLRQSLLRSGVNTDYLLQREGASGTAVITVDKAGENTIVISAGANGTLSPGDIDNAAPAIRQAHTLGLCLEVGMETVIRAAQIAREAGTTVVFNLSPLLEVPAQLLELVDVLIVNEHELAQLAQVDPASVTVHNQRGIQAALEKTAVPQAVVTLGGDGSLIYTDSTLQALPAFRVVPVDTTGAGDAFMGTLLAAMAADFSLLEAGALASCVAALATTKLGAQNSYPTGQEVSNFLHSLV